MSDPSLAIIPPKHAHILKIEDIPELLYLGFKIVPECSKTYSFVKLMGWLFIFIHADSLLNYEWRYLKDLPFLVKPLWFCKTQKHEDSATGASLMPYVSIMCGDHEVLSLFIINSDGKKLKKVWNVNVNIPWIM